MPLLTQIEEHNNNKSAYFISVIVAIKNEEHYIQKCLESLLNQTFSKKSFQIIIVDGGSTDNTLHIVERYLGKYPDFISLHHNPKQWQAVGRNIAIRNDKKSDLISYIDGHCIAEPHWLENLYNSFLESDSNQLGGVGSIHYSPDDESILGKSIEQVFSTPIGGFGSSYQPEKKKRQVQTAPFVLYSKSALKDVGYYDEDMKIGEDYTLNYKLQKKKYSLYVEPKAIVYYYKKQSLPAFFQQMFNYGIAKAIIVKKYPSSLSFFHFLPIIFSFAFLFLVFIGMFMPVIFFFVIFLFIIYISILFYYALLTSITKKQFYFCYLMPCIFVLQHVGYSIGFLKGLFKKSWEI
jgi:succinoglycan biosynthesis protein ExoA